MTKEDILTIKLCGRNIPTIKNCIEAMQEYADQCLSGQSAIIENLASQVVELRAELTRLQDENSMLLERVNNG